MSVPTSPAARPLSHAPAPPSLSAGADGATPTPPADDVARLAAGYTATQRRLEIAGVTAWFCLCALALARLGVAVAAAPLPTWVAAMAIGVAAVAGLLAADLASGVVHWAADNWGDVDWPVLGSAFIRPFRLHHLDAEDITRHTWLELNGNNCIVSLPLFLAANATMAPSAWGLAAGTFFVSLSAWVLATNQIHAWAHTERPRAAVRLLQRSGLILSPTHHDRHHARPHDRNYCITNGWFNAPLRALHAFEGLEWLISRGTGTEAHHHRIARGEPLV